ncbi:MAG: hypothetical protein RLT05_02535 [Bauldia litoralis]
MKRALAAVAMLAGLAGPVVAQNEPVPDGLSCPVEIAGGERIAVGEVTRNPDVTGYCIYYLVGETDFEAVTMTLRTAPAGFDWRAAYQAPKIERGGMELVEEGTRAMPFGGDQQVAEVATIKVAEKDLGPISESFSTLWVFDLGNGRSLSLEEEYNNVSEPMRAALREALLETQG